VLDVDGTHPLHIAGPQRLHRAVLAASGVNLSDDATVVCLAAG
jgi:hypothetical protein